MRTIWWILVVAVLLTVSCDKASDDAKTEKTGEEPSGEAASEEPDEAEGPDEVGKELLALCVIAEEVNADPSIPPDMRPMEIVQRLQAMGPSEELQEILGGIATAHPDERETYLSDAAREHGVPDYSCAALEGP